MLDALQHNSISSVEFLNDGLADDMINICLKPFLSARQLFKMAFGRFCALGLKNTSQMFIPFHHGSHFVGEELFFGCNRYRINSNIDTNSFSVATKNTIDIEISGDRDMQKHPMFMVIDKVSRINIPIKILFVIFSNIDRYLYSAVDTAKRYFILFKSKTSCIVSDCKKLFKFRFRTLFFKNRFKNLASLISTATDKLGWNVKQFTNNSIGCIVENSFIVNVLIVANISDYLSRCGVLLHCIKKSLIKWESDLHCGNSFHSNCNVNWGFKVLSPIPPLVKTSGFLGGIL